MVATGMFHLGGKVALVTGASGGLGAHFGEVLAANGAAVVLVARRADHLAMRVAQIERAGGRAISCVADVRDRDAIARAFDIAEVAFGTVDILINNAGVAHTDRAAELSETEWRRVLDTNLDAVLFWSQEAGRRMMAAGRAGAIINIASILGLGAAKGVAAYAVAKAGVVQLTRVLGLEWASKGIRVNAIAPGWIVTDLNRDFLTSPKGATIRNAIPLGRFGTASDLDGALLLLASDAGRFMVGTTLVVDGGQTSAISGSI